jgi:hypothetical protein
LLFEELPICCVRILVSKIILEVLDEMKSVTSKSICGMTQGLHISPLVGCLESVQSVDPVFGLKAVMCRISMIQGYLALFAVYDYWCRCGCCHGVAWDSRGSQKM